MRVRRQATHRLFCAAILCLALSTALAATVEWHTIGDPPFGSPPPTALVLSPAAPTASNTINFVSPCDGEVYFNASEAAAVSGDPMISIDSTNLIVTVTFTPPLGGPVPMIAILASGIDGQFGPLEAGTWRFQVFNHSGALTFSTCFTVAGPSLGTTAAGPPLGIALSSNQIAVSWPAWGSNYALQASSDPSSGTWCNITNGITTDGTNYFFLDAASSQTAYFRLRHQ
jgi:hypothetical protein